MFVYCLPKFILTQRMSELVDQREGASLSAQTVPRSAVSGPLNGFQAVPSPAVDNHCKCMVRM